MIQPGALSFLTVYFYIKLLSMGTCGQEWNNYDVYPLCSCTWVDLFLFDFFFFFVPGPTRLIHFVLHCELRDSRGISCGGVQRLTEGAKNASTEEAGTLNHLWGTDLYISPNIKRQYLASVSQTSDRARRQWQTVLSSSRGVVPCNKWQQRSFNHIFLACRGLIHAWVAISGGGCTELGSPGCCCLFFLARLFWLVERRSLRLLTFSPALLWICIFMNGAQEGMGELDARQTKKTTEGRRGGKVGGGGPI